MTSLSLANLHWTMAANTNTGNNINLRSTKRNAEQNVAPHSEKYVEDSLKVKFDNIKTLISRQKDELDAAFSSAIESCRNELSGKISETNSRIDNVESDLKLANNTILELKQKIASLESREKDHLALTKSNIFQACRNEQRLRSWSIKISNFQLMSTDEFPSVEMIWQELILPSLKQALARGQLKWVPEHRDGVIEHGHEGGSRYDGPRQFYIRFHSRSQMYGFFNNMKPIVKSIEERNALIMDPANKPTANKVARYFPGKKIKVISSITNMHADLWGYLYTYDEVEHVKTVGNFLGVKLRGSNNYQRVTNPFGLSLAQMLEPMPTVTSVLSRVCSPVPPLVSYSMEKKSGPFTVGRNSAHIGAAPVIPAAPVTVAAAPVSAAAAPLPAVAAPLPAVAAPLSAAVTPLPVVAASVPAAAAPIPAVAAPLSVVAAPLPTVAAPLPAVAAPLPAAVAPLPVVAAPIPAAAPLLVAAPAPASVPTAFVGDSGVVMPQP